MDWQAILALVVAILIAYGVILWIGIVVWANRDIRERTRDSWSQTLAVALVALFNIPGLVLYLLLRPADTLAEAYERRLEAEALMRDLAELRRSCPRCERRVGEEYLFCPHCRSRLREPCATCGRALELGWLACPYCGAEAQRAGQARTQPLVPAEYAAAQPPPPVAEPSPAAGVAGQSRSDSGGRPSARPAQRPVTPRAETSPPPSPQTEPRR